MKKLFILLLLTLLPVVSFSQGTWSPLSGDGFAKNWAPASAVVDGKIYVIGGFVNNLGSGYSGNYDSVWIYSPQTNTWTNPHPTGTFTHRRSHAAVEYDGKIYVMGGIGGAPGFSSDTLNSLEIYDPALNSWSSPTTTGNMTKRGGFSANVVNGKIYVIGGRNEGILVETIDVFDPATSTWSNLPYTGTFKPRSTPASCVVNNKIYVMAGSFSNTELSNDVEIFDPYTSSWSTPTMTGNFTPRRGAASSVVDGKIFVIAGIGYENGQSIYLNVVEVFDPISDTWTTPITTGTCSERSGLVAHTVDNKIFAIGGQNYSSIGMNTCEMFTPTSSGIRITNTSSSTTLSPNPTTGLITVDGISGQAAHMTISNLLGQTIIEHTVAETPNYTFDLSEFPSGVYYLRMTTISTDVVKKIIKQ